MRLDELRSDLHRTARQMGPGGGEDRVAGTRAKIAHARRRRAAVTVGTVAVVVIAVVAVPLGLANRDAATVDPANRPNPTPGTAPTFAPSIGGDELLAQSVGKPGQKKVTLRFVPHDLNLEWSSFCQDSTGQTSSLTINGHKVSLDDCRPNVPPSVGGLVPTAVFDNDRTRNAKKLKDLGVVPGRQSTITVVVNDVSGPPDPHVQLGAAVYELNGPRTSAKGHVLKNLVESDGRTYRLVSYGVQRVADGRRLELPLKTKANEFYLARGTLGQGPSSAKISFRMDNKPIGSGPIGVRTFGSMTREGATSIAMVANSKVPDTTTLLLAVYAPVDD